MNPMWVAIAQSKSKWRHGRKKRRRKRLIGSKAKCETAKARRQLGNEEKRHKKKNVKTEKRPKQAKCEMAVLKKLESWKGAAL